MLDWATLPYKKYTQFTGRSQRSEFWYYILLLLVGYIVAATIDAAVFGKPSAFYSLWALINLIPGIAVAVRRLHDIGKSGWWILIGFVPVIGAILLIVWYATDGTPGSNEHGPDPKGRG